MSTDRVASPGSGSPPRPDEKPLRITGLNWRSGFGARRIPIGLVTMAAYLRGLQTQIVSISEDFRPHGGPKSSGELLAERLGFVARYTPGQGPWALPGGRCHSGYVGHCLLVDPALLGGARLGTTSIGDLGDVDPFERHAITASFMTRAGRRVNIVSAYASHKQLERLRFSQTARLAQLADDIHGAAPEAARPITVLIGDFNTPRWKMRRIAQRHGMAMAVRGATSPARIYYSARGAYGTIQNTVPVPIPPFTQLDHLLIQGAGTADTIVGWLDRRPPLDHVVIGADLLLDGVPPSQPLPPRGGRELSRMLSRGRTHHILGPPLSASPDSGGTRQTSRTTRDILGQQFPHGSSKRPTGDGRGRRQ